MPLTAEQSEQNKKFALAVLDASADSNKTTSGTTHDNQTQAKPHHSSMTDERAQKFGLAFYKFMSTGERFRNAYTNTKDTTMYWGERFNIGGFRMQLAAHGSLQFTVDGDAEQAFIENHPPTQQGCQYDHSEEQLRAYYANRVAWQHLQKYLPQFTADIQAKLAQGILTDDAKKTLNARFAFVILEGTRDFIARSISAESKSTETAGPLITYAKNNNLKKSGDLTEAQVNLIAEHFFRHVIALGNDVHADADPVLLDIQRKFEEYDKTNRSGFLINKCQYITGDDFKKFASLVIGGIEGDAMYRASHQLAKLSRYFPQILTTEGLLQAESQDIINKRFAFAILQGVRKYGSSANRWAKHLYKAVTEAGSKDNDDDDDQQWIASYEELTDDGANAIAFAYFSYVIELNCVYRPNEDSLYQYVESALEQCRQTLFTGYLPGHISFKLTDDTDFNSRVQDAVKATEDNIKNYTSVSTQLAVLGTHFPQLSIYEVPMENAESRLSGRFLIKLSDESKQNILSAEMLRYEGTPPHQFAEFMNIKSTDEQLRNSMCLFISSVWQVAEKHKLEARSPIAISEGLLSTPAWNNSNENYLEMRFLMIMLKLTQHTAKNIADAQNMLDSALSDHLTNPRVSAFLKQYSHAFSLMIYYSLGGHSHQVFPDQIFVDTIGRLADALDLDIKSPGRVKLNSVKLSNGGTKSRATIAAPGAGQARETFHDQMMAANGGADGLVPMRTITDHKSQGTNR